MSIEIAVAGFEKVSTTIHCMMLLHWNKELMSFLSFSQPYVFGTLLNRDETFSNIVNHGLKANLEWAASTALHNDLSIDHDAKEASETDGCDLMEETDQVKSSAASFRMSALRQREEEEEAEIGRSVELLVDI